MTPMRHVRRALSALLAGAAACGAAANNEPAGSDSRSTRVVDPAAVHAAQRRAEPRTSALEGNDAVRRVALVVGNAAYTQIGPLRNATNDAEDMCAALRRLAFEASCQLNVATRTEFRRLLRQFASALGPQTVALFYFAGHGVQSGGRNYLLPTAIAPNNVADLEAEGLALGEVFAALREARSPLNIVMLDACRDDPFAGRGNVRLARGLAREEPPLGSVLVYSTAPGGVAADGAGRNGHFTSQLLAEIEAPGPQIGEMLHTVARRVEATARRSYGIDQVPYRSLSFTGVFCFAECDRERLTDQMNSLRQQATQAANRIRELEAQNAALAGPGRPTEQTRRDLEARTNELAALRGELKDLSAKAAQIEAYRDRIATLERENREKEQRLVEGAKKEEARRVRPTVVPSF